FYSWTHNGNVVGQDTFATITVTGGPDTVSLIYSFKNLCSLDTVTQVFNPGYLISVRDTICEGDSIFFGNEWISLAGNYFDTIATGTCDTLMGLSLIVVLTSIDTVDAYFCRGDSFFVAGGFQSQPGMYVDTLTNSAGCDSIVYTNLRFQYFRDTFSISICA